MGVTNQTKLTFDNYLKKISIDGSQNGCYQEHFMFENWLNESQVQLFSYDLNVAIWTLLIVTSAIFMRIIKQNIRNIKTWSIRIAGMDVLKVTQSNTVVHANLDETNSSLSIKH